MAQARCTFSYHLSLDAGHRCRTHAHGCTEVVVSFDCAGELHQKGKHLRYSPRTAFVYQPGGAHWIVNLTPGRQVCLGVVGGGAEDLPEGVFPADAELMSIAALAADLAGKDSALRPAKLDFVAGLLVARLRELAECADTGPARASPKATAARARRLIDDALTERLDLADLARQLYVSQGYLRELFRREHGESPMHYVVRRRIDRAKRLLETTSDPVHRIATECGFASPYYFSRAFSRLAGMSPKAWRASHARDQA